MASNKKPAADSTNPYDADLEKQVDELMAPDTDAKKIEITHDTPSEPEPVETTEAVSAPLLPNAEVPVEPIKKTKIAISHDETPAAEAEPIAEVPADTPVESEEAEPQEPDITEPVLETEVVEPVDTEEIAEETLPDPTAVTIDDALLTDTFDDEHTDTLVDDIVAKEGDELLAVEDERAAQSSVTTKPGLKARLKDIFANWWRNPTTRWLTIVVVLGALLAAFGIPASRYTVLNSVGVRSSAVITVTDRSTTQPLKNVTVKIADQTGQTDDKGTVKLQHLRLGATTLHIEKRAFTPITQKTTIGWGSNPLPGYDLVPSGSQYSFAITDYLSGKPVSAAKVSSDYADANADDKGVAKLTLDKDVTDAVDVTISSPGMRDEHLTLNTDSKEQIVVKMVSHRKHAYVSNRSGKYDLYKIDVDGKNDQVVLAGTGNERADMVIASDPSQNIVAMVSTREPVRNKDGYLLSTLTIVDLDSGATIKVSQSEQIQLVGWRDGRLAYVQIASGASAANPDRQRLMSYNYATHDNKQLASANYFNDVLAAGSSIYYAPTGGNSNPTGDFTQINFDGSNKKVILVGETWNAFRTDYTHIVLSVPGAWYQHVIGSATATKLDGQPGNTTSRVYIDSPDGKHSLWVDKRDGKGVLLNYDTTGQKDATLLAKTGLSYPIKWLDNHTIIYRISTDGEIADYALSTDEGEPKKIHEVTTTGSNDRWYYY